MGKKTRNNISLLAALAVLWTPLVCRAADVSELYQLYDEEYKVDIPEEILTTINTYDYAKKYVSMYNSVVSSEYDTSILEQELSNLLEEKDELTNALRSGYTRDLQESLALEDRYAEVLARIDNVQAAMQSFAVDVTTIDAGSVPSYSEYTTAMREKNAIMAEQEIGQLSDIEVPAQSGAKLLSHNSEFSSYRVVDGTGVLSVFNGVVDDVYISDDYGLVVVVDNKNGVKTHFCNLELADVVIGETVYQNQRLGYVYGTKLLLRMQLGDTFVDISKLFTEV